MSGSLAAPLSTFSADSAKPAVPILPDGFSLGGWLEQLEAVGGGLVRVVVSGREYLVDDSLQEKLAALMGQHMSVGHYFGQWGCGAISSLKPDLLFYRHLLCAALGGLDNMEERLMVRFLILKIDAKEGLQ